MRISDFLATVRQRHVANKLRRKSVRLYDGDPSVVFHLAPPEWRDASHGINTEEEMAVDAHSDTD